MSLIQQSETTLHEAFPVLIADDEVIALKVLTSTLIKAGFHVAVVKNGIEALEVMKECYYPIVLTGWVMPELDGIELCRKIRSMEFEGYVYIIILTSNEARHEIVTGMEAGADDYLIKPCHRSELLARIGAGMRILKLERELKKANDEIRLLSETDALTGCYNRGYITRHLPRELQRELRYRRPFSIVLWDIDRFKSINDTWGHLTGDAVLKGFASSLVNNIRNDLDWVARYGGEEFITVLPETSPEGAFTHAERIRQIVASTPVRFDGREIPITVSYGCTGFDAHQEMDGVTYEKMIGFADRLLYTSKNEGRNRGTVSPME